MSNHSAVQPPNHNRFKAGNPGARMVTRLTPYRQAIRLQDIIMARCDREDCDNGVLAQLARAWDVLEERKRILKFVPKPKDIDLSPEGLAKQLKRIRAAKRVLELGNTNAAGADPTAIDVPTQG